MTANGIFVTGTDTGIGKTFVACAIAKGLVREGLRVAVMKPVAAGLDPDTGASPDVVALTAAANVDAAAADVNPYAFEPAIAPRVAAARAGVAIDLDRITAAYRRLAARADAVVVEGAGGAMVPLDDRHDMLDICVALRLPVLLVVGIRLGCLNHALLSALAIRARGLVLAGWIANRIDAGMPAADDSVRMLADMLTAPLVVDVGWRDDGVPQPLRAAAKQLWPLRR